MKKRLVVKVISIFFILLFVYSALSIMLDKVNFSRQISGFPLISRHAQQLTWLIPAAEILVAALLVFRITRVTGLIVSLLFVILYTSYSSGVLSRHSEIHFKSPYFPYALSLKSNLICNLVVLGLAATGVFLQLSTIEYKSYLNQ